MSELPSFRSSLSGFHRGDVIQFIKKLMDEKADLENALAALNDENASLKAEVENCKKQLAEIQSERQNEQLLGRAMYDARRFSDTIVQEANDSANDILNQAVEASQEVAENLDDISGQAAETKDFIAASMAAIEAKLSDLRGQLAAFEEEAANKSREFDVSVSEDVPASDENVGEPSEREGAESAEKNNETAPTRVTLRKVKRPDGKK